MRQKIIAAGDRMTPGLMARLRGEPLPPRRTMAHEFIALREEAGALRQEVSELREEIDECRRDNVRIAELTEVVERRLAGDRQP